MNINRSPTSPDCSTRLKARFALAGRDNARSTAQVGLAFENELLRRQVDRAAHEAS